MRKIIGFLVLVAVAALGAMWLEDNSGHIVLTSRSFVAETSVARALFILAVIVVVLLAVSGALATLLRAPARLRARRMEDRRRRGLVALSNGMIAVAAGDARAAERHAKDARNLLDDPPLTLLLSAQAAQVAGNETDAEKHFAAMLTEPRTEFLGVRGLFVQAQRRGDRALALTHLRRAAALRPGTPWVVGTLFDFYARDGRWSDAGDALTDLQKAKLIDETVARRRRAVLLAAEAMDVAAKDPARALSLAEEAVRLSPGLTPAAVLAARLLGKDGKVWRAQAVIENAWAQAPHPELAVVYAALKPDETPRAQASRLMGLAERNSEHVESRILTAQQWAELKDFTQARAALGDLPLQLPSARLAALMAEIGQGSGVPGEGRFWLDRALHAPRDPQWVCESCHSPAPAWGPVCPVCEGFDTLSWRAQSGRLAVLPALPPEFPAYAPPGPVTSTALILDGEPPPPAPHGAAPPGSAPEVPPGANPVSVRPAPPPWRADPEPAPVMFVSPRAPDDPGTEEGTPTNAPGRAW